MYIYNVYNCVSCRGRQAIYFFIYNIYLFEKQTKRKKIRETKYSGRERKIDRDNCASSFTSADTDTGKAH